MDHMPKGRSRKGVTLENGVHVVNTLDLMRVEKPDYTPRYPSAGRPTIYNDDIADYLCHEMAKGRLLLDICQESSVTTDDGKVLTMPSFGTVQGWAFRNYNGFKVRYATAEMMGCHALAQQVFRVANDSSKDWREIINEAGEAIKLPDHDHIARSRLRVDYAKWYLSKRLANVYGDKITIETNVVESDIQISLAEVMSPAELEDLRQRFIRLEARKRTEQAQKQNAIVLAPESNVSAPESETVQTTVQTVQTVPNSSVKSNVLARNSNVLAHESRACPKCYSQPCVCAPDTPNTL